MTVHSFDTQYKTEQNSSDNLPSYLQTNIISQMLSIRVQGAKFSASRPLDPVYSFLATMASTSSSLFGAVVSLKFLATENIPQIVVKLHTVDNAMRGGRLSVAVLLDNCHPSSYYYYY